MCIKADHVHELRLLCKRIGGQRDIAAIHQAGATLIELIVSIVILSIASVGIMMLITNTTLNSANPMIRSQATAIAQAYMEEILSQPMTDPDGNETGESRASFDDLSDYNGLSDTNGAVSQSGDLIAGLEGYNVTVTVTDSSLNGVAAKKVAVTVSYDGDPNFSLPMTAYRLN